MSSDLSLFGALGALLLGSTAVHAENSRLWTYSIPGNESGYVELVAPKSTLINGLPKANKQNADINLSKTDFGWTASLAGSSNPSRTPYLIGAKAIKQAYPGTLVYHVWTPSIGDEKLPSFRSLTINAQQPADILLDNFQVRNLEKYVPSSELKSKWRLISEGSDAERVRAQLESMGIPESALNQLTFQA